jgi:hypothetical protein
MAFAGRGKLSILMAAASVGYVLLLPSYASAALVYNLVGRPKKNRAWANTFMCQRCGASINPLRSAA